MVFWTSFTCAKDIPPLTGRVILITGGNSGLGLQSALEFARHRPRHIYITARSDEKAQAAIEKINARLLAEKTVPDREQLPLISYLVLDLASLASVKDGTARFLATEDRLDILMLNAGIMMTPPGLTSDGYELQFGTNHVGHALLAKLLLPLLLRTAAGPPPKKQLEQEQQQSLPQAPPAPRDEGEPKTDTRVIVLTSSAIGWAPSGGIQFASLRTPAPRMLSAQRYGQSKLANALWAHELAARHPSLTVAAVHPGVVGTNLLWSPERRSGAVERALLALSRPAFFAAVEDGVRNQMWAAVSHDVVSGEYYVPVGAMRRGSRTYKNGEELGRRLWEWTENELKGYEV